MKPADPDSSRAVLIGAHTFRHLPPLGPVEGNVTRLGQLLTSDDVGGLTPDHCVERLQPADPGSLLDDLHRAAEEATDLLVVYYAGHGITDPGDERQLYLALPESEPTGKWYRTLRYADIREAVSRSPAVHKVVVIDCCFSGIALAGGMSAAEPAKAAPQVLATRAEIDKTCVLTASAETATAFCPPSGPYSAFTGELIALLEGGLAGPVPGDEDGLPGEHRPVLDLNVVYRSLHAGLRAKGLPLPQVGSRNLGGDIPLARNRAYVGPGRGVPDLASRLNTLSAVRDVFIGRETEIGRLTAAARQTAEAGGGPGVCVVHGMGGVGKSELLRQVAARVAPLFDAAHFEIDLAGFTPQREPRDPDQIIIEHLQLIGFQPAEIPQDPAGRAEAWRSWLSGRRALLLLDNARDAHQLRTLLPGPKSPSLALISSRDRLGDIDADIRLGVAGLSRTESIALLHKVGEGDGAGAGAERGDLAEIAARCHDIPVALRPVGVLLRDMPVAEVLTSMRRDDPLVHVLDGYEAVRLAFTTSYDALPEALRTLLWHCAWHPGDDFGRDSIAVMVGEPGAGVGLTQLVQRNLLLADGDRLSFHDLFRRHASAAAEPRAAAVRTEARARLYGHLADRLHAASTSVYGVAVHGEETADGPEFTDPRAARAWLEQRSGELRAAAFEALAEGWPGSGLLALRLAGWLRLIGVVEQARALSSALLAAAEDSGNRLRQIDALIIVAHTYRTQYDYGRARDFFRKALDLAETTGDRARRSGVLTGIADIHHMRHDHDRARELYREARTLAEACGDHHRRAEVLTGIAHTHRMQDDYGRAGDLFREALALAEDIGDRVRQVAALTGIAHSHFMQDDFDGSRGFFRRALGMAEALGDRLHQGSSLTGIAQTFRMQGDYERSRRFFREALGIAEALGDRLRQTVALIGIAHTYRAQGDDERSRGFFRKALDLAEAIDNRYQQAEALTGIARSYRVRGDYDQAEDLYRKALELADDIGDRYRRAEALTGIGHTYRAQGDDERAGGFFREALTLAEAIGERTQLADVLTGIGLVCQRAGDADQARAHYQRALSLSHTGGAELTVAYIQDRLRLLEDDQV
ncbi:tetratricopeptide repeat protein [Streptomyces sp. NPDC006645]|uniref:caspase, EACC1-associated type n=1 Tax=unclassified Streptomyces TaxID=2593676 RepID=UPI0033A4DCF8